MDDFRFDDPACSGLIASAAGVHFNPVCDRSIARVRGDVCLSGVLYTNFTHESICAHTAVFADRGVNRAMLYMGLDYPFNQLKVKRIFGWVPETNTRAQAFNMKLGFKVVARIEGVFRHGVAALIMCCEREDARLLKIENLVRLH